MVALTRWPTILLVALHVFGCAGQAHAKRAPSAFGDDYDARESAPPRASDIDGVPDIARDRPPTSPRRVKPPRPGKRHKITLDGSDGVDRKTIEKGEDF